MRDIEEILMKINKNPGVNQRSLSQLCGLSLGKVNALIEDIEGNGFIKKEINGREHRYFVTPKGIVFLEKMLHYSTEVVIDLHVDTDLKLKTAVILAAGRNQQFHLPVCMQSLGNQMLIERTIGQLKNLEFETIIVVGGYQLDQLRCVLPQDIIVVSNEDFKWTGTMASLAKAYPYIKEDFLLIESDIVVETPGLQELVKSIDRDAVLITAESGSGDEAFVEIRNNRLFKISKDIAQLNRIDGEMVGISKLSFEFLDKMMEYYKDNQNPYLNYEYLMLDVARTYKLGYKKMDSLLWHEVDELHHLEYIRTKMLKRINKKEKMVHIESLKNLVCECLNVEINEIKEISVIGGMTNKNYKVILKNEQFVLRIPGNGTEKMISRQQEVKNAAFAYEIGVDADLIYFNEKTGIKISKFIENAQTLSAEGVKQPYTMKKVCKILNQVHKSTRVMDNEFNVYEKIEEYEQLLTELQGEYYSDYKQIKQKVLDLKQLMNKLEVQLVPCHNDTVAENFIKDGEERYYLIDWEYGGMNDPMWDIAAHCLENGFSYEEEELFLKIYFQNEPREEYKIRVLVNKIYQDFLWSLWTKVKEASGDDFGTYGIDRYNRAKSNLILLEEWGV